MKNMFTFVLLKERKQISRGAAAKPPERRMDMKNKPSFEKFLKDIYGMTIFEYQNKLSAAQQKAVEIDYKDRYGSIKWFD